MFLIHCVPSRDNVFKGLCDFMSWSFLQQVTTSPTSVAIGCGSSDTAAKIFYVTLQDYVIKGSGDFMEGNSSLHIPILPKLIVIDIVLMHI